MQKGIDETCICVHLVHNGGFERLTPTIKHAYNRIVHVSLYEFTSAQLTF